MDSGLSIQLLGEIILASHRATSGILQAVSGRLSASFAVDVALILSVLDNLGYLGSYFTLKSQEEPSRVHLVIAEVWDRVSITIDDCHFVDN